MAHKNERVEYTNILRVIEGARKNARQGRVLIAKPWFEADPYTAAVTGILTSIHIAAGTGISGGMNDHEFQILMEVRKRLLELDPALNTGYKVPVEAE